MAAVPWWRSLTWVIWWILSRVWAPFVAIGWPALIVYGLCNPNPADMARLRLKGTETALLVGVAGSDAKDLRSYVVFPRVLSDPGVMVINEASDSSLVTEAKDAALIMFLVWVMTIYLTWRFWVLGILAAARGRQAPSRLK